MKSIILLLLIMYNILIGAIIIIQSSKLIEYKNLTGYTASQITQIKSECEKSLPRDKSCTIIVKAQANEN